MLWNKFNNLEHERIIMIISPQAIFCIHCLFRWSYRQLALPLWPAASDWRVIHSVDSILAVVILTVCKFLNVRCYPCLVSCVKCIKSENVTTEILALRLITSRKFDNIMYCKMWSAFFNVTCLCFISISSVQLRVKLNPGLPWQKPLSTRRRLSLPVNWT